MKNSSDTIGNRSRDLPVCSAVPQPLHHRVPPSYKVDDDTVSPNKKVQLISVKFSKIKFQYNPLKDPRVFTDVHRQEWTERKERSQQAFHTEAKAPEQEVIMLLVTCMDVKLCVWL
jgi:hypothetical protein